MWAKHEVFQEKLHLIWHNQFKLETDKFRMIKGLSFSINWLEIERKSKEKKDHKAPCKHNFNIVYTLIEDTKPRNLQ